MRKLIYLTLILFIFLSCGPKQQEVERYIEDGVEVIVNHLEPYKIKGEPSTLHLEEEFTIDTEKDDIAEIGLWETYGFDIDSEGNIYFVDIKNTDNVIFKFNRDGDFVKSFGRRGQGPGEIQRSLIPTINSRDEITLTDSMRRFLVFNKDGELVKDTTLNFRALRLIPLENGNYLILKQIMEQNSDYIPQLPLELSNSKFEKNKGTL